MCHSNLVGELGVKQLQSKIIWPWEYVIPSWHMRQLNLSPEAGIQVHLKEPQPVSLCLWWLVSWLVAFSFFLLRPTAYLPRLFQTGLLWCVISAEVVRLKQKNLFSIRKTPNCPCASERRKRTHLPGWCGKINIWVFWGGVGIGGVSQRCLFSAEISRLVRCCF